MGLFDLILAGMAVTSLALIIYNMRLGSTLRRELRVSVKSAGRSGVVEFSGRRLRPVVFVSEDIVRDETGTLGERLASLARSARLNVTYATSLFSVEKSRLLAAIEDEIKKAEFAYNATRHVRYQERLKFLKNLYFDVVRSHTPYVYRYTVIVWVDADDPAGDARAEAFRSMVEAEAGVRLARWKTDIVGSLLPSHPLPVSGSAYASMIANLGESPGIIVGTDKEGRVVVLSWPQDFETHMGVFGPTGRGKTVFLAGIASQLGARSDSRLDPLMVLVVDPKGDLARLLKGQASTVKRLEKGSCIQVPRTTGAVKELVDGILNSRLSTSVRPCEGTLLRRGLVVYDLSGLPNEDRDVAASLIIASLAIEASESTLPGRVVLVLDEAWRTNLAGARHFELMLREGRSRLLHAIYATQSPVDLPPGVLSNTGTIVVFGGYTRAYTESARLLGIDDSRLLLSLPVGTAIMRVRDSAPIEVRVLGFHEYVKREPASHPLGSDGSVVENGQEAEAAEGGQRIAHIQEPRPHTPGAGEVPAAIQGDAEG